MQQKLQNFHAYLAPFCTTEEQKARLDKYRDMDAVLPFLLQAIALKKAGTLTAMLDSYIAEFDIAEAEREAVRAKVGRYIDMFCDVLIS